MSGVTEPPAAALLAAQQVVPFVFNHYTPSAAYRQKINALATRTQVQARDVFDLHHLTQYAAAGREATNGRLERPPCLFTIWLTIFQPGMSMRRS